MPDFGRKPPRGPLAPRSHPRSQKLGSGGMVSRRCTACHRDVLEAHRGDVMAVGKARLVRVDRDGNVYAICECGKQEVWTREPARGR